MGLGLMLAGMTSVVFVVMIVTQEELSMCYRGFICDILSVETGWKELLVSDPDNIVEHSVPFVKCSGPGSA